MRSRLPLFCLLLLLFLRLPAFGQPAVDKFCVVTIVGGGFTGDRYKAHLSMGEVDSLFRFRDVSVVEKLKQVNSLTNAVDVMNYMALLGWSVVSLAPTLYQHHEVERIYFKKSYLLSELAPAN